MIWYGYQNTIFGTQSTVNGSAFNYAFAPPPGGTWTWSGTTTNFAVRENDGATTFNGDPTNEQVSAQEQIGGTWEQVAEVNGSLQQIIWDYTFEITAGDGTVYRVAVIDVDLNNDNDLDDTVGGASEDGYYLVFPDGVPPAGQSYTIGNIVENDAGTPHLGLGAVIACFASGTAIRTPDGPRRVEDLAPGDLVETLDSGPQPVRWAGASRVAALGRFAPVVIARGTLGNTRDLVVSPQHRMLLGGWRAELLFGADQVFAKAVDLLDGDRIYRRPGGHVTYHHILLDRHEVIFAEDAETESLMPGVTTLAGMDPAMTAEILTLFPELGRDPAAYGPTARISLRGFETACLMG